MKVTASHPLKLRLPEGVVHLVPGVATELPDHHALRLLQRRPDAVQAAGPQPPLCAGWLVVYRDAQDCLWGGADDRAHGTVACCDWLDHDWRVTLTDGKVLPLRAIRSVAKVDAAGRLVAAWLTEQHGYDGEG